MIDFANISCHTLSNGLKCLHIHTPGASVEYTGATVNVGSRNDPDGLEGLAHFVEHTIFKGTSHRKSWHIINRMESCGGELNAYTTKETTVVYSVFPTGNFNRAAELIADLVANSQFPNKELDKERDVVADEIESYLDIPSEAVFDDFEDELFQGSSLGHNILGNKTSLARFDSDICRGYLMRHYVGNNMVLHYNGSLKADKVFRIFERLFGNIAPGERTNAQIITPNTSVFHNQRSLGIHQAHTIIGTRICDMYSPQRFALALLTNIIGGPGMNSMLNVALRERHGLVYSVEATSSMLTDTGMFAIYFGCDPEDLSKCTRLINNSINSLLKQPLSERQLAQTKRQYLGQLAVASENTENATLSMARALLYRGEVSHPKVLTETINALSTTDLQDAAALINPERLSSLTFC